MLFHHTGSYHLFLLREISKNHNSFSLVSTLETQHMWVAVFQYIQHAPRKYGMLFTQLNQYLQTRVDTSFHSFWIIAKFMARPISARAVHPAAVMSLVRIIAVAVNVKGSNFIAEIE